MESVQQPLDVIGRRFVGRDHHPEAGDLGPGQRRRRKELRLVGRPRGSRHQCRCRLVYEWADVGRRTVHHRGSAPRRVDPGVPRNRDPRLIHAQLPEPLAVCGVDRVHLGQAAEGAPKQPSGRPPEPAGTFGKGRGQQRRGHTPAVSRPDQPGPHLPLGEHDQARGQRPEKLAERSPPVPGQVIRVCGSHAVGKLPCGGRGVGEENVEVGFEAPKLSEHGIGLVAFANRGRVHPREGSPGVAATGPALQPPGRLGPPLQRPSHLGRGAR